MLDTRIIQQHIRVLESSGQDGCQLYVFSLRAHVQHKYIDVKGVQAKSFFFTTHLEVKSLVTKINENTIFEDIMICILCQNNVLISILFYNLIFFYF